MTTTLKVRLEPLEPLLFGDNRSARFGESHAVGSQDPSPATLFGAVGGHIAQRLGARGERHWRSAEPVLGPFEPEIGSSSTGRETAELEGFTLADAEGRPWFPQPLHLRVDHARRALAVELMRPRPEEDGPSLSSLPIGWRPLAATAIAEDEVEGGLLLDEDLLAAVLAGTLELPHELAASARERDGFFSSEARLGLAMSNAANTALPGRLFARPYRRFHAAVRQGFGWESAGFLAWLRVLGLGGRPENDFDGTAFLGGDRRRARLRFAREDDRPLAAIRDAVTAQAAGSKGYLLYLLTPAPVPADGAVTFEGELPVGGAVGRTVFASGWSAAAEAKGPRRMQPLFPAGSVFFFEWGPQRTGTAERKLWIEEKWLASLTPAARREGFGRVLLGVWT